METRTTHDRASVAAQGPGQPLTAAAGTIVFKQGDAADAVFQVIEGRIQLSMLSSSGRNAIVATLGPGSFLGEVMLLESSLRTHTATAVTACRLVAIAPEEMRELLHSHPDVESQFIGHMLRRINRLDADLADLLF
ncbi:MAG: cyclic nucleotide-binding domain-containing protein, partial [Acidobacteriota bacterium]